MAFLEQWKIFKFYQRFYSLYYSTKCSCFNMCKVRENECLLFESSPVEIPVEIPVVEIPAVEINRYWSSSENQCCDMKGMNLSIGNTENGRFISRVRVIIVTNLQQTNWKKSFYYRYRSKIRIAHLEKPEASTWFFSWADILCRVSWNRHPGLYWRHKINLH